MDGHSVGDTVTRYLPAIIIAYTMRIKTIDLAAKQRTLLSVAFDTPAYSHKLPCQCFNYTTEVLL